MKTNKYFSSKYVELDFVWIIWILKNKNRCVLIMLLYTCVSVFFLEWQRKKEKGKKFPQLSHISFLSFLHSYPISLFPQFFCGFYYLIHKSCSTDQLISFFLILYSTRVFELREVYDQRCIYLYQIGGNCPTTI